MKIPLLAVAQLGERYNGIVESGVRSPRLHTFLQYISCKLLNIKENIFFLTLLLQYNKKNLPYFYPYFLPYMRTGKLEHERTKS